MIYFWLKSIDFELLDLFLSCWNQFCHDVLDLDQKCGLNYDWIRFQTKSGSKSIRLHELRNRWYIGVHMCLGPMSGPFHPFYLCPILFPKLVHLFSLFRELSPSSVDSVPRDLCPSVWLFWSKDIYCILWFLVPSPKWTGLFSLSSQWCITCPF